MKQYWQYMKELKADEVYRGLLLGMFSEKLPPMFTMVQFFEKKKQDGSKVTLGSESRYISFDAVRNTGAVRRLNIPVPFGYERLCRYVKELWPTLQKFFYDQTNGHEHKISQIHIRRMDGVPTIFKMNYHSFRQEEDVVSDLRLKARYLVETDISTCFPSIYTHAFAWAASSKKQAKQNFKAKRKDWGDALDEYLRQIKDKETNGIFIGPHASNLVSEIILTRVDKKMYFKGKEHGFAYVRRIDDYECYAETNEAAEYFLASLKDELAYYNLSLNYKKTSIKSLPLGVDESWKNRLNAALAILPEGKIGRSAVVSFLDLVVELMKDSGNAAVLSYAVKAMSKKFLSEDARQYYVKYVLHLAYLYPYIYSFLDDAVFYSFDVESKDVKALSERMMMHGLTTRNFEEVSYALYFAVRYGFVVESFDAKKILETGDCILLTIAWKYACVKGLQDEKKDIEAYARSLLQHKSDFEENWLFVYEALGHGDLKAMGGEWYALKKSKVSFIKTADEMTPTHTPDQEFYPIVWTCRIKAENSLVQDPFRDLHNAFVDDNQPFRGSELARQYLSCIVGNLLVCARLRRNLQIHRSEKYYEDVEAFGDNGELHDVKVLHVVLNWLRLKHLIGERIGTREKGGSRFWPKDELIKLFVDFNLARVHRKDESEVIVLKDRLKNPMLPTPKSCVATKYRAVLECANRIYEQHRFSCKLFGSASDDMFCPRLKAVFNDGRWDHGGRLYASATSVGFNYQCIPSDMRKEIKIDGKDSVEIDYSSMHPHMLYALRGKKLIGSAYDFLPYEDKPLAKFALLVMLNAKSRKSAIGALSARFEDLRYATGLSPKKFALREAMFRNRDFEAVLDRASMRHKEIRANFYRGTGVALQNIESKIALEIVEHFTKKDIPVLPVHDSFVVEKAHVQELREVMAAVYKKYNNGNVCPIK